MKRKLCALVVFGLGLSLGSAKAADRAAVDCDAAPDPTRMVAGCNQLLQRRNLPRRLVAMILRNRGIGYQKGGDMNHAFADFSAALQTDPSFAVAYESRGLIYKQANDFDHAFADFDAAVRLDPKIGAFIMNRGIVWFLKGHIPEALADLDVAVRLDPTNPATYWNRAGAREAGGDKAGALADLDAVLRMVPGEPQVTALRDRVAGEMQAQVAGKPAIRPIYRDEINATLQRIDVLYNKDQFKDALQLAQDLEARVKATFGPDSYEEAFTLARKGMAQGGVQDYQGARESEERALAIDAKQVRFDMDLRLSLKEDLSQTYEALGRYADADKLMEEAVAGIRQQQGAESDEYANALNSQAILDLRMARYAVAETRETQAVAIWRKLSLEDRMVGGLDILASIFHDTARDKQAEDYYQRSLAIKQKAHGEESKDVGRGFGNLGIFYSDVGRYAEAEKAERRAVAIFEKVDGPMAPSVAQSLTNLANLLSVERHDSEAETVLQRALVIDEKAFGPDNSNVAFALGSLATVMERGGRDAEAEPLLRRDLAITEKAFGPDHPDVAIVLNNLAGALSDPKRAAEKEALYRRSLAINEKVKGKDNPFDIGTYTNLANVAWAQDHMDEAEASFKRALAIADKTERPDPESLDTLLNQYARFSQQKGALPQAEALATRAVAHAKAAFGPDNLRVSTDLSELAFVEDDENRWSDSLPLWRQASEIALKGNRAEAAGPGAKAAAGLVTDNAHGFVRAAWRVAAADPVQAATLAQQAFVAAQQAQTSVAGTALAQMAARFGAGDGAIAAAVRRQQDLSAQAKALGDRLIAALGAKADETQLAALRSEIADTSANLDKVGHEIASGYPKYAELSSPEPPDLAATRALLGPDEALISWLIFNKEVMVFAVTREGSAWKKIDIDNLSETVSKLRAGLDMDAVTMGMARKKPPQDVLFDLAAAHGLYEKLVAPVSDLVAGKHDWIVVPSGALTSLPLALLVTKAPDHAPQTTDDSAYREAAWLAREHAISVLPSISSLRALRVYAKPSQATEALAGFADPVFSPAQLVAANDAAPQTRSLAVKSYRSYFRGGAVDLDALRTDLPPLPETATELREVARELKAPDTDLRVGAAATVTAVKAMPLDRFHVIYFATHGLVAGDVDGLDEPALALSIPAKPTPADDGLLKASDVTQLKLDADWVVLSACNTAVGVTPGAEGLSGLARAFFYAGARALLVSHWPVDSNAAVALTTQSFRALAEDPKLGRAEALRRSMMALVEKGGESAYPAIWAPFSVVGEGGLR